MNTRHRILPTLLALGLLATASAQAAEYSFSFVSTSPGAGYDVHGLVTTSDVLNSLGGYDITAVTGLVQGTAGGGLIDSLVANPTPGTPFDNGSYLYDNVAYAPGSPTLLDTYGVLFTTAANAVSPAATWNLYSAGGTTYELYSYTGFNGGVTDYTGSLTVAAVPEPSTCLMMVSGLLCLGVLARRRQSGPG